MTLHAMWQKFTSLNDKTATETKKQSMITDKQDKYYKKVLKKWKKEEKITVHKGSWNKISFTKLSVKAKDTSTTGTGSTLVTKRIKIMGSIHRVLPIIL